MLFKETQRLALMNAKSQNEFVPFFFAHRDLIKIQATKYLAEVSSIYFYNLYNISYTDLIPYLVPKVLVVKNIWASQLRKSAHLKLL